MFFLPQKGSYKLMHLGVVDYGASNIHSVARALQSLGSKVSIVDTPD